jgi:hypothetical protein
MVLGLVPVRRERRLQLRIGCLALHLRQRLEDLAFGVEHVLQGVKEQVVQVSMVMGPERE